MGSGGGMNWQVGGTIQVGAGPATAGNSWASSTGTSITLGAPVQFQLITLPAVSLGGNTPPTVGMVEVVAVHGSVYFYTPGAPGVYDLFVGICVVKQSSTATNVWEFVDPGTTGDAQRDDWLYLNSWVGYIPVSDTTAVAIEFPIQIPAGVVMGAGQALAVIASTTTNSTIFALPEIRAAYRVR